MVYFEGSFIEQKASDKPDVCIHCGAQSPGRLTDLNHPRTNYGAQ